MGSNETDSENICNTFWHNTLCPGVVCQLAGRAQSEL